MRYVFAVLVIFASPASAQSPRDAMFPSDTSCYLRQYSRDHLAKHPNQLVTGISIGPDQDQWESDILLLNLSVTLRGRDESFAGVAYCENTGGVLSCGLEGDAGWFMLKPRPKGAVLLSVGKDGISFEGNSSFVSLEGTRGDDREFLLPPVPADACP